MYTRLVQVLLGACAVTVVTALAAKSAVQEFSQFESDWQTRAVLHGSVAATAVFWYVVMVWGRRLVEGVGLTGLATISLMAGLQFAAMFASRILGTWLSALAGPFAVFVNGIGDNGVPCLLLAVVVTLLPRPGTALLTLVTVWLLYVVTTGVFGLTPIVFISTTVVLHESLLAAAGVSIGPALKEPAAAAPWGCVLRVALAIGLAKAGVVYAQNELYISLYRLQFTQLYVVAVSLVTGLLYGGVGAGIGTMLGYRLRRTAA